MLKNILKNLFILSFAAIASIIYSSCNENSIKPEEQKEITSSIQFPEFFEEKGSDSDTSYISFKGTLINNDTLEIEATSWGVIEYGLFLYRHNYHYGIQYNFMGECGTVSSHTWQKVTLKEWITKAEADTLWSLRFTNSRDTIEVVKTTIH